MCSSRMLRLSPSLGPPATCSQHRCGLTGAVVRLGSGAHGSGSMAYLPGLAADAASTAAGLSTGRRSFPREVRALRPHGTCTHAHGP